MLFFLTIILYLSLLLIIIRHLYTVNDKKYVVSIAPQHTNNTSTTRWRWQCCCTLFMCVPQWDYMLRSTLLSYDDIVLLFRCCHRHRRRCCCYYYCYFILFSSILLRLLLLYDIAIPPSQLFLAFVQFRWSQKQNRIFFGISDSLTSLYSLFMRFSFKRKSRINPVSSAPSPPAALSALRWFTPTLFYSFFSLEFHRFFYRKFKCNNISNL